jgi:hypothetical protein
MGAPDTNIPKEDSARLETMSWVLGRPSLLDSWADIGGNAVIEQTRGTVCEILAPPSSPKLRLPIHLLRVSRF